ncbi:MAG: lysophospholipid acyltransferase family protein [Gemmatimonas sp.]|uniref:lysophospholipid acyltransferase family protein n=1 Tax=Gemmatimonas sp. TaxID=1962908 RepID=UPI0025C40198|nr:lysophospholipid acyltransferase family protein [Gemmatimonas sp.]MCA2987216.1 lysophospholipid acyltransferase family protein [Gemmatimonas sp.]
MSTAVQTPAADPAPTLSHRLEYVATRAAVAALRLVGWRAASWVGGTLAKLAYRPFGIRAGVTERQIAAAFPERSPHEVRVLAARSYESLGRTSIETAILPGTSREEILARIERVDGWEHIDAALAKGRGIIAVTGHIGNWELGGAYVAARGVGIDAVVRGAANKLFEAYVTKTRTEAGVLVVHDKDAVRRTPRALRDNRMVALLADHDALGLASTFVPFFGRPAKTPRGPAVFALRFDTPMVFIAIVRQPSGRYAFLVEPVEITPTGDREHDVDAIVQRYTQLLEARVREYPEQYFWQHRRWRRQPPDTPPHLREP